MDIKRLQFHYFIGLLIVVLVLSVALLWPFIAPLALAGMAAIVARPMHRRIQRAFGKHATLAALVSVAIVLLVVFVPLAAIVERISIESYGFISSVAANQDGLVSVAESVIRPIQTVFPTFNPNVSGYVTSAYDMLVGNAKGLFSGTISFALGFVVALIALFYMFRDGKKFKDELIILSPLSDKYDREIIEKVERAVNSVVRGSLFVALLRGILTGFGFALFGVPHPVIWAAVTAVVSLLPNIGLFITLIPAVAYLIAQGSIGGGIALAAWSLILVGFVDNVVMPVVMGKGFTVHPLLVLLSVLGGLIFFGPIGVLLGPLVIALLSALLEIYKMIVIDRTSKEAREFLR